KAKNTLLALDDVARIQRGLTTGANEFFYLKSVGHSLAPESSLHEPTSRARKTTKVTGRSFVNVQDSEGAHHQIESRFLAPVVFSLKEIPVIWLAQIESRRLFFNCTLTRDELSDTQALRYIQSGERAGYHQRPSCAARDSWYTVTRRRQPAP